MPSKKNLTRPIAVGLTATVMSAGAVVAAFGADGRQAGYAILWPVLPMALLLCTAAALNRCLLTPRLLMRGHITSYVLSLFAVVYAAMISTYCLEYLIREGLSLPHRISDYTSPWILVDAMSSSMLIMILLGGLSLETVYDGWRSMSEQLKNLRMRLGRNITLIKEMLKPRRIFESIDTITRLAAVNADKANDGIRDLSEHLRTQLYGMPEFERTEASEIIGGALRRSGRIKDFIVMRRFRPARHALFQLTLATIAATTLFETPDCPVITSDSLLGTLALYVVLNIVAFVNIRLLYPRFLKKNNTRQYITLSVKVTLILALAIIPLQMATDSQTVYNRDLPLMLTSISALSSAITILIFIFGTASLIYLQRWLRNTYEISELEAQTAVFELDYLKKQINPHFLFNVLNNAGIMIYEDPTVAVRMLRELTVLLRYQLDEAGRTHTTLGEEAEFLQSYLLLEKSRRTRFCFTLESPAEYRNLKIPVLMYIPFVENAVKYATERDGRKRIDVTFAVSGDELVFSCANTFDGTVTKKPTQGGIGIANTKRRLELLYGDNYSLLHGENHGVYYVKLAVKI